ncbi:GGDEF domain-containing protein [Marinobacter sp. SS13-12]|uniref:GGDEF domain-containing protein n=1 Tax=Marinobacter sp. SS13-12 TaxID=3050451 RepID=UPI002553E2DC|nr:GGDEF domain-containing protein [Marinobacter sp. SS13-12]MDK8463507.1 7TM diverse intracellular signaling domain-containing protein [Marinobacter sp. SS13-12]
MQRIVFRLLAAALILLGGWWHAPLYAELRPFTSQPAEAMDLQQGGRLYIAHGQTFPETYQGLPEWSAQQSPVEAVALTGGDYWLLGEVRHEGSTTAWVLDPNNSLIDRVEARVYSEDGDIQVLHTGYQHDHEYMLHYGKRIQLQPDTTYRVLVRFSSPYFSSHPEFEVMPETDYRHKVAIENALILLAFGSLIALAIFNLFVFLSTRDRSQLYYAFYLLAYFVAWAFVFHLPVEFFGYRNISLHYVPFFLLPVLNTLFYLEFLKLDQYNPMLAKLSRCNQVLALLLLPSCFFAVSYAHSLATVVITFWLALALVSGILSWRRGYRPARYFVFAFVALIIPGLLILPANIGLTSELVDNAELLTLLGGTLDALLLAFALADKIKLLSEQKDRYLNNLNDALKLANTDGLTGLGNRYAFDTYLDNFFQFSAEADDEAQQIIFLIDLDGLKTINDTYGHTAGDELLRLFADGLRTHCGEGSDSYRLGGDEFGILSTRRQEPLLHEAIRHIEGILIAAGFKEAGVSYGVAYASECSLPSHLFTISDRRMYQHKLSRRKSGGVAATS